MADDAHNPYAPPVDSAPAAEPAGLWTVAGDSLLVRDGARLPRVSLEGEGDDLTPTVRVFTAVGRGQFLPLVLGLGWIAYAESAGISHGFVVGMLIAVFGGRLLRRFIGTGGSARIQGFSSALELRKRAKRLRWRARIIWIGFGVIILSLAGIGIVVPLAILGGHDPGDRFSAAFGWLLPLAGSGLALAFSAALWQAFDQGLRCVALRDGWLEIRGVPPASLAILSRKVDAAPPPMRKRLVSTFYQYRLPLMMLVGKHRWNPRILLTLAILKAKKSPRLERQQFHWSEAATLPASAADAELRARWEKAAGEPVFAGWTAEMAERIDYPAGDLRIEALVVASPDRRAFGLLTLSRVATGNYFAEVHEAVFRSWTADGRCLATGSSRMIEPLPTWLEFRRAKGSLGSLARAHLGRAGGETVAVPDRDALLERLRREADERNALFEAAGLQSPFEEVEMPDVPAE